MKTQRLLLLLLTAGLLVGCRGGDKKNKSEPIILKDAYKDYFTIGGTFNEFNFDSKVVNHFNSMTCENAMKWISVHPSLDTYDYVDADKYVAFAKEHDLKIRGHALVWHNEKSISADVFASNDKETVIGIEKDHVDNVIKHFKDDVYCWDVCNEVIDDGTSELKEDGSNIYRQSAWYNICGRDFIKEAYLQADATLKELGLRDKVKLYYNDYDNTKPAKRSKTLAMLQWLIDEDVPIDGVGLQCHYHTGSFDMKQLEDSIIAYSELGLDVQITEFDVDIYDRTQSDLTDYSSYADVPEEVLNVQATIYGRAFEIFRRHKDKISNVTFWGVSDDNTYMNNNPDYGMLTNYPYVFDVFQEPKPAFYAITDFLNNGEKKFNPYASRKNEDVSNVYNGGGNDFHISSWYASDYGQIDVNETSTETEVFYMKTFGYEYTSIFSSVMGPLADFAYINFVARGTPGKNVTLRMYYGNQDDEVHNVLGNDVAFSLTEDATIHSLRVKGTMTSKLDLLKKIVIIPEMGLSSVNGRFYISDVYFSKTLPEEARLENPGVDSGDTSVIVNGWRTEGWTNYSLYPVGTGVGIKYNSAGEWGFVEKTLDINEGDNGLYFQFENILELDTPSVTVIHFILRGDVKEHISEGVEYEYDVFYEAPIYTYDLTKEEEVQADEEGLTTLELSLENALETIGEHHVELGYRLTLLIESHPDDLDKYLYNTNGQMVIKDVHTYHGDFDVEYYSLTGEGPYELLNKEGVDKNIIYTNVKGNAYWPRVSRRMEGTTHTSAITITIRNNGENSVRIAVHAGMINDPRSDSKNNFFFPLWKNSGKSGDYFADGMDVDILPGESAVVTISVDEQFTAENDVIDTVQFLVDNCYGDEETRSGNIDIVSVDVA